MTSPSNTRVIEVINFLAAHPTEAFTLSELAEQLSLSHGSAHRVLNALTEARYLSRHPKHKTYSLGLALVAIGQAALEKHRAVDIARREMVKLADQLQVRCIATTIVEDEMLFVAKEGLPQMLEELSRVGERRPFIPPFALCHAAWAAPEQVEAYFAKADGSLNDEMRNYLLESMATIRQRGYSIAAMGPGMEVLRQAIHKHASNYREPEYWQRMNSYISKLQPDEIQLQDLADLENRDISFLAAPVFAPNGDVILEISLSGLPAQTSASDLKLYSDRLRAMTALITSETHGRMPARD